jgi:histidine transport system permease protein
MIDIIQNYWQAWLWNDGYHLSGVAMTLWLLIASVLCGFCLSIPLAVARVSSRRWIRGPVWFYTYVFRGTPLYIQLLIFYSGIYSLHVVRSVELLEHFFREGINCTILAFALNTCAYTTKSLPAPSGPYPMARSRQPVHWACRPGSSTPRIIIPAMLRRALPYYSNEVILMLHATTVAFTATVPDILKVARDVNAATYASFEAFGIAAVLYACIAFGLVWLFRQCENRWLAFLRPMGH